MQSLMLRHWHRFCFLVLWTIPNFACAANSALGDANEIDVGGGSGSVDLKQVIIDVVQAVLKYVALLAVVMLIVAGIWLIVGFGEDSSKEKAKKIVIYTIVGLLLIMLAEAIVQFVLNLGGGGN